MLNLYLVTAEIVMFLLFLLCLRHTWRAGLPSMIMLLVGVLFGVILEWATIQQLHAYHYGPFVLMLGNVPIMIGVAWGTIIYSALVFASSTSLPNWARPILIGWLGLTIDLGMDAIAIRLGMWDWGRGLAYESFGVPYANYWAWFWVGSSFATGYTVVVNHRWAAAMWLAPIAALLIGLIGVLGTNALIVFVIPQLCYAPTILLTLGGALVLILMLRPRVVAHQIPSLVYWVPLGFQGYFLLAGLISGVIFQPPVLLLISLVMIGVTVGVHWAHVRANIGAAS